MHVQQKSTWLHPNFVSVNEEQLEYAPDKQDADAALLHTDPLRQDVPHGLSGARRAQLCGAPHQHPQGGEGRDAAGGDEAAGAAAALDGPPFDPQLPLLLSLRRQDAVHRQGPRRGPHARRGTGEAGGGGFEKGRCELVLSTIARGLEGLHRRGFGHWNLNSRTVVITDGRASKLKLWNFGVLLGMESSSGTLPVGSSPQRAEGRPMAPEDDLWSMGCILLELISGVPTERRHAAEGRWASAALSQEEVLAAVEDCSRNSPLASTARKLLRSEPAERPTVFEIAAWDTPLP